MGGPPRIIVVPDASAERIRSRLRPLGIELRPHRVGFDREVDEYTCRRGWVTCSLDIFSPDGGEAAFAVIAADTSMYRWGNFPAVWFVGIFLTLPSLRLQKEIAEILENAQRSDPGPLGVG